MSPHDERLLDSLREVADVLVYSFDFDLMSRGRSTLWFEVRDAECEAFAFDATGGTYVACTWADGSREVLHVDATGVVGHLGADVAECCALVVALPFWRDLLQAMARGATRQHLLGLVERLEREVTDDVPVLGAARENLLATTGIEPIERPVQRFFDLNFDPRLVDVVFDHLLLTGFVDNDGRSEALPMQHKGS